MSTEEMFSSSDKNFIIEDKQDLNGSRISNRLMLYNIIEEKGPKT